jgi:hypothetical protein
VVVTGSALAAAPALPISGGVTVSFFRQPGGAQPREQQPLVVRRACVGGTLDALSLGQLPVGIYLVEEFLPNAARAFSVRARRPSVLVFCQLT